MTAKIVQLTSPTPSALIRAKIQRETAVLESRRGLNATMSARDTLIDYAEVLELNAVYLTELKHCRDGSKDQALACRINCQQVICT